MPIRIEYGAQVSPGLPAMAQTAMRIRAEAAAAALRAQRGSGGGGGGRGGQTNLAQQKYDLAAQQAYYNKQAAGQKSDDAIQQAEYEQRLKEQGFNYEYTETARQELAQINNSRQRVKSNEDYNSEEQATILRQLDQKEFGIEKSAVPAAPEKFPEGKRVGDTWKSESGGLNTRNPDGREVELTEYKNTPEGIQSQWDYEQKQEINKFMMGIATEEIRDPKTKELRLRNETEIGQIKANLVTAMSEPDEADEAAEALQQQELIDSSARIFGMGDQQQQDPAAEEQAGFIGLAEQLGVQPNEKEQRLPGDVGAMFAILRTVDERYTDEDGKIDFSKAPPELIQNLEIMEQRAASWLASEQLDRNRKPIPKKKGLKRGKVGGFMGGTMVGQF